jgi:hypothetical protein
MRARVRVSVRDGVRVRVRVRVTMKTRVRVRKMSGGKKSTFLHTWKMYIQHIKKPTFLDYISKVHYLFF